MDALLVDVARRWPEGHFVAAGAREASDVAWPSNVDRLGHVVPTEHCRFYGAQRFTLNVSRTTTSRLFEAAACGTAM